MRVAEKLDWKGLNIQILPQSIQPASAIKTDQFMMYTEIIAVSSEIRTEHINTLCGQNTECFNVRPGGK
jgi:hypothetical protein